MKRFLLCLLLPLSGTLFALQSGDIGEPLKVQWLQGAPVSFGPPEEVLASRPWHVLTVIDPVGTDVDQTLALLTALSQDPAWQEMRFAVLSGGDRRVYQRALAKHPKLRASAAWDSSGENLTRWMSDSVLFPHSFIVDHRGKIIWNGETMDLVIVLDSWKNKTFDEKTSIELSRRQNELQQALRAGDEQLAANLTKQILAVCPDYVPTLRLRLFMLESTNRAREAWNLLNGQLKKAPDSRRLYLFAFDLIGRYRFLAPELERVTARYLQLADLSIRDRSMVAWSLLVPRNFQSTFLRSAGMILQTMKDAPLPMPSEETHLLCSVRALYASIFGRFDEAVKHQQLAVKALGDPRSGEAVELLAYYRSMAELARQ